MKQKQKFWARSQVTESPRTRPALRTWIRRPRLFRWLEQALSCYPVIWISAPPGAGKTTLVASYLAEAKIPALWHPRGKALVRQSSRDLERPVIRVLDDFDGDAEVAASGWTPRPLSAAQASLWAGPGP